MRQLQNVYELQDSTIERFDSDSSRELYRAIGLDYYTETGPDGSSFRGLETRNWERHAPDRETLARLILKHRSAR